MKSLPLALPPAGAQHSKPMKIVRKQWRHLPALSMPVFLLLAAGLLPAAAQAQFGPSYDNPGTPLTREADPVASAGAFFRSRDWLAPEANRNCDDPTRFRPAVPNPADCGRIQQLPLTDNRPYIASALRPGIMQRQAPTQYTLGKQYDVDGGLQTNYGEAAKWYGAAAEQSNPDAHWQLGTMFESAAGVPFSEQNALHHYQSGAVLGSREAQRDLASFTAGRDYTVGPDGGALYAKGNALSGYGEPLWLMPGDTVMVFARYPEWMRVYVPAANRWGWMRQAELRLGFAPG